MALFGPQRGVRRESGMHTDADVCRPLSIYGFTPWHDSHARLAPCWEAGAGLGWPRKSTSASDFNWEKPVMSPAEARIKEVPPEMTEAEGDQRVNLAACYRLIAHYGWDDLVDTHISARVPGPDHHFLINPYGLMFDEITASSLVKVDLDGNQLSKSDYSINPAGFTIHSAIHEVREDAGCVLHLHTPDGTAVASTMEGLLPMNQTAQLVTHDLAYHDYEGIALDHDERPRLQKDLGNKNHMLLRNHGTLTVGRSVASAFERMFHLERACTMQVRTRMLGPTAYPVEQAVVDKNASLFSDPNRQELRSTTLVWPALLRKVDRLDPSYKN